MITSPTHISITWETGCSYATPVKKQKGSGSYQDRRMDLIGSLHVTTQACQPTCGETGLHVHTCTIQGANSAEVQWFTLVQYA